MKEKKYANDSEDEPIDDCDDFTLGMDASLTFGSASVTPRLLTSFGGTDDEPIDDGIFIQQHLV